MLYNLPFDLNLKKELKRLTQKDQLTFVNLGNTTAKSFLISRIQETESFKNIFWASTDEQAHDVHPVAKDFFSGDIVLIPEEGGLREYYRFLTEAKKTSQTLFLFEHLSSTLEKKFPSLAQLKEAQIELKKGQEIQIFDLFSRLGDQGYSSAEDQVLVPGEFVRRGENLFIYPINEPECIRIQLSDDKIETIEVFDQDPEAFPKPISKVQIYPVEMDEGEGQFLDVIGGCDKSLFISDDLDEDICPKGNFKKIKFTTFPKENETFFHLNFFSVLPFYTTPDFVMEIKERFRREFDVVVATKRLEEIENIFRENDIMFTQDMEETMPSTVKIVPLGKEAFVPHSFQNNDRKCLFLTDREIFQFARQSRKKKSVSGINLDLMTSLKPGDYVIHLDHGIGRFEGIIRREIETFGTREYLRIAYAENDKLFVPVESAEKVTKFIGDEEPRLTKLGAADWQKSQKKLKEETEKIAQELLKLYAKRELSEGKEGVPNDEKMELFCDDFPYELTPGQAAAWNDVRADLERKRPMDRMVCGDVGFGKTEIAMRAAFKNYRAGYQTAILAPITILAEQHYQSFMKRVGDRKYGVRIELLSRFQTPAKQKKILEDLKLGLVDIVIGTHRLLSEDVSFKDINLLIIDEEQRFGVKQKERLKRFRTNVNVLTMTATPIPRTLHMSLNRLKDISTITTPPPGRLPVVTEVRKFNLNLIRERIQYELDRGGQVYFLHNQVKTIESQAQQLRSLLPEASFIVAHGQLSPQELEARINKFKRGEFNVLVASTIIENGIDLPNANTLLVNHAEKFGLSQLYQLRGRVGRRRTQAYSFFLYHGQKLELEAKKRLRAIVEASELGSGFQIAMRDLEIRGAGEILGANQSGAMKSVGVSHFMRMLNKTVEAMKSGEISSDIEEEEAISVEVPLTAFIPASFIASADEKIQVYKELASAESEDQLSELRRELKDDYGYLPKEVENLFRVIRLKLLLRAAHLNGVKIHQSSHKDHEIVLRLGKEFSPDQIFGLLKESDKKWVVTATAIKLQVKKLPIDWYDDLVGEVRLLSAENKEQKSK